MLIKPSIDNLLEKVDSKYTLVIAAAQRGRQIRELEIEKKSEEKFVASKNSLELKEVSIALDEIHKDMIEYHYRPDDEELEDLINAKADEENALLSNDGESSTESNDTKDVKLQAESDASSKQEVPK